MRGRWGAAWAAQLQKLRHGRAHEDSRTPLVPSKGACWAGRDSKPLHLHHRWNRERWRTESADFCQTSFKSSRTFVVTHSRPSVSVTFWGTICASRFSDLTCGSGEKRQSAREPERRARRRLACSRGREPISRRRLCVSERWIQRRAGLSGGSSAAETGSSSEINCSPLSWTEAQVSFLFFFENRRKAVEARRIALFTRVWSGQKKVGCLRGCECSRRRWPQLVSYFTFCALCHCGKLSLFKSGLSKGTFVLFLSKINSFCRICHVTFSWTVHN